MIGPVRRHRGAGRSLDALSVVVDFTCDHGAHWPEVMAAATHWVETPLLAPLCPMNVRFTLDGSLLERVVCLRF